VFGIGFSTAGLFGGVLPVFKMLHGWQQARGWQPVPAQVVEVELKTERGSKSLTYQVRARYRYRHAGIDLEGTRVGLSAPDGADNIGTWHQDWHDRLQQAKAADRPITVWVNPARPQQAVIDRDLRWKHLLFLVPFATLFPAVGIGAFWALWRVLRMPAAEADATVVPPNPREIRSDSRRASWFLWLFALFWNLLSFPIAILALSDAGREGGLVWLVAIFPLVGIGMLVVAIRTSLARRRFGDPSLTLSQDRPLTGNPLAGMIRFDKPPETGARFKVILLCEQVDTRGDSNRSRTVWQQQKTAQSRGDTLAFTFEPDENLPGSEPESDTYHRWRIKFQTEEDAFDQAFDIRIDRPAGSAPYREAAAKPLTPVEQQQLKQRVRRLKLVFNGIGFLVLAFFLWNVADIFIDRGNSRAPASAQASSDDDLMSVFDRGDLPELRRRFDAGDSPNAFADNGSSLLMMAAARRNMPLVRLLLERGVDVNAINRSPIQGKAGRTALMIALYEADAEIARLLMDTGARDDLVDGYGWKAVHHAARRGCIPCMQLLKERRLDIDAPAPGSRGETPMMVAAQFGHPALIRWLIDQGADPLAKDRHGENVLGWARFFKQQAAIDALAGYAGSQ